VITNDELVAAFNGYVRHYNDEHAAGIASGELQPLQESTAGFIEKASGIKQRYVYERDGVLESGRMRPRLQRDSHFIFGDVCTAVIIEAAKGCQSDDCYEIVSMKLVTHYSNTIRNNFGFMNAAEDTDLFSADKLFRQQGRKVFKDVVPMVVGLLTRHLAASGLNARELRRMWLHQTNAKMNELIARMLLGRDARPDEAPMILEEFANTASAGSIIAFHRHRHGVRAGDYGVICSFGAGYSIGSILLRKLGD
jgi:beta-ketodecanoyl-[acyl-carrier-protein] synthase